MSLVYWDSMLFIYLFDKHPEFGPRVNRILNRMQERNDTLCTSAFGVAELLAGPVRAGKIDEASRIRTFFQAPDLHIIDFRATTAELYAQVRGRLGTGSGDSIHLACAAEAEVDLFLTHDKRLARKIVPGINFIATLDTDIL